MDRSGGICIKNRGISWGLILDPIFLFLVLRLLYFRHCKIRGFGQAQIDDSDQ